MKTKATPRSPLDKMQKSQRRKFLSDVADGTRRMCNDTSPEHRNYQRVRHRFMLDILKYYDAAGGDIVEEASFLLEVTDKPTDVLALANEIKHLCVSGDGFHRDAFGPAHWTARAAEEVERVELDASEFWRTAEGLLKSDPEQQCCMKDAIDLHSRMDGEQ